MVFVPDVFGYHVEASGADVDNRLLSEIEKRPTGPHQLAMCAALLPVFTEILSKRPS